MHLMCETHQIIFVEGTLPESADLGPLALKSMGATARREVLALRPDLCRAQDKGAVSALDVPTARECSLN